VCQLRTNIRKRLSINDPICLWYYYRKKIKTTRGSAFLFRVESNYLINTTIQTITDNSLSRPPILEPSIQGQFCQLNTFKKRISCELRTLTVWDYYSLFMMIFSNYRGSIISKYQDILSIILSRDHIIKVMNTPYQ
jgi:hypothetical protein